MARVRSFRAVFGAVATRDEHAQRRAAIWRIGCLRWLCILGVIALNRTPLTSAVCIVGALSNIVPFGFAGRFTTRHLRLLGWILLLLDAAALSLASVPMVEKRNFPLLLLLLFFEASIPLGFEPPWLSSAGMAGITLVTVSYGYVAARFRDSARDIILWASFCLFLGIRGALLARARWRYRQQLWTEDATSTQPPDETTVEPGESSLHAEANPLSVREQEILILAARGRSNKEIASELSISARTVSTHFERIALRLHAHNRSHAVAIALAHHWIEQLPLGSADDGDTS